MAYIIGKSQSGAVAEPVSLLAKSQDFGRMRDTFILASKYRNRDCMRLWSDFAAEQPAMARLIIRDVENDRRDAAAANWEIDRRLQKAEKLVTKGKKPKSVAKSREKASPALRDALRAANEVLRAAEQESRNPELRAWAEMAARG